MAIFGKSPCHVPGCASCKIGVQFSNPTNHDIVPKNLTFLGKHQLVKSVTPLEVLHKELTEQKEADLSEGTEPELIPVSDSDLEAFDPDVDLSELHPTQKEIQGNIHVRNVIHSQNLEKK